jgi:hypothetical protein
MSCSKPALPEQSSAENSVTEPGKKKDPAALLQGLFMKAKSKSFDELR